MATPWEIEANRRRKLIEQIYRDELGRGEVDQEGLRYWMEQAHNLNNDGKLRDAIVNSAGPRRAPTPPPPGDQPSPLTEHTANTAQAGGDAAWEAEAARRRALIEQIYYQELGVAQPDAAGMQYWMNESQKLNNDDKLRDAIRAAAPAATSPAPSTDLANDAAYKQYLRQMAFDETTIQDNLTSARNRALNSIQSQSPFYDLQRDQAERNVNNRFESRGMFQAGGRLAAGAESRNAIDANQRRFEEGQQTSIADAERSAASDLARLQRERADQEVAARNRLTQNSIV